MLFVSVFRSLSVGPRVLLCAVILFLAGVGFFLQRRLTRARAPLPLALLPTVLAALAVFLLFGVSLGWISLPFPAYLSLVLGGYTRLWGACCEGFLIGCIAAWAARLFDRNIQRKS